MVHVRVYRDSLQAALTGHERVVVLGTAMSRADALGRVHELQPEVVLVDVCVPDALEIIRDLRGEFPHLHVIAFGLEESMSAIIDCAEAGAAGYVPASGSIDDLSHAVEGVAHDEVVCPPRITAALFRRLSERAQHPPMPPDGRTLTGRERQVLDLLARGLSNKEIAQTLNLAAPTVKNHVHHLFEKLNAKSRVEIAARLLNPNGTRQQEPVRSAGDHSD